MKRLKRKYAMKNKKERGKKETFKDEKFVNKLQKKRSIEIRRKY
jgi:hypothetical protein